MNYELNAKICLPPPRGGAQVCEINIARCADMGTALFGMEDVKAEQPSIVTAILDTLYEELGVVQGALSVTYFIKTVYP